MNYKIKKIVKLKIKNDKDVTMMKEIIKIDSANEIHIANSNEKYKRFFSITSRYLFLKIFFCVYLSYTLFKLFYVYF
jgi:hypothetical protein